VLRKEKKILACEAAGEILHPGKETEVQSGQTGTAGDQNTFERNPEKPRIFLHESTADRTRVTEI
jgi:hypothetical protein